MPARRQPPARQVRADTEQRLLAVRFAPSAVSAGRRLDATGSRRRLQALATLGWSIPTLALHSALTTRTLRRALTANTVTADTARTITALYDRLHSKPAPRRTPAEHAAADRTITRRRQAGWRPPLTWQDIDNDPDGRDTPGTPPACGDESPAHLRTW